jgi:hypothetical protein
MKKTILLCLSLLNISAAIAQKKVDLDKFYFDISFQRLPEVNVPKEQRTYGVRAVVGTPVKKYIDENSLYDRIHLIGWEKVESNPTVGLEVSLDDYVFRGSTGKNETTENKDKDGKVTSRTTTYWVEATYQSRGLLKIKGPVNEKAPSEKELAEQKKKTEAVQTNRFLANANISKPVEDNTSRTINLSRSDVFKTDNFKNSTEASNSFTTNADAIYDSQLRAFADGSVSITNDNINRMYGFAPYESRDYLWILNSKDHPEYQVQKEAIAAIKELFKTMKAHESIEGLENNLAPLIEYMESLKTKYTDDDKSSKKIRYSAYYNLSKIYYFLDRPEKAAKEAEGLIKNDYDKKDGEDLLERANNLKALFDRTKFTSRHN